MTVFASSVNDPSLGVVDIFLGGVGANPAPGVGRGSVCVGGLVWDQWDQDAGNMVAGEDTVRVE